MGNKLVHRAKASVTMSCQSGLHNVGVVAGDMISEIAVSILKFLLPVMFTQLAFMQICTRKYPPKACIVLFATICHYPDCIMSILISTTIK
jgi:predicted branched-subunit amino acid permease